MRNQAAPRRSPLALYVHWPFCKAKCPYCDFNSHVRESVEQEAWAAALLAELAYFAAQVPGRALTSIFFGGGTPSLMPAETVAAVIDAAGSHWPADADIEITLEANPTSVEAEKFKAFRAAGVNRVSLGVQAMNQDDLHFLGRQHDVGEALRAVALARDIFPRYSFDLIYARPHQTVAAWEEELTQALEYADGHMSLYQLTIEQGTKFYQAYHHQKAFTLPDEDTAAALFTRTQEIMEARGLPAYEISNHAKPGQESRHNLSYWKSHEYIGVGPGAHGRLSCGSPKARAQEPSQLPRDSALARRATQNFRSPEKWLEMVQRQGHGVETSLPLSLAEQVEEFVMMGLRLREGIPIAALDARFGDTWRPLVSAGKRAQLTEQGLLEDTDRALCATRSGRLLLNAITASLLA